jgi:hypothetical protein
MRSTWAPPVTALKLKIKIDQSSFFQCVLRQSTDLLARNNQQILTFELSFKCLEFSAHLAADGSGGAGGKENGGASRDKDRRELQERCGIARFVGSPES